MEFDREDMVNIITDINPEFVNIGANTRNDIKLPEPTSKEVNLFINCLNKITKVNVKPNLKRLGV